MRMSIECIVVMAHAMGRTLVVPPYQHLYLLNKNKKAVRNKAAAATAAAAARRVRQGKESQPLQVQKPVTDTFTQTKSNNRNNNNNNNENHANDFQQQRRRRRRRLQQSQSLQLPSLQQPPHKKYRQQQKQQPYSQHNQRQRRRSLLQQKDDELGFEDFFDINILKQQQGLKVISMQAFLQKEGLTGNLRGMFPPGNRTDIWGTHTLWPYLDKSADVTPEWENKFLAMPLNASHYKLDNINSVDYPVKARERFEKFVIKSGGSNKQHLVYYDEGLQNKRHIHIPGDDSHRLLMHHYTFAFFADVRQQRFYKRFVRDFIRYKDDIHCVGHDVIQAIRQDALLTHPHSHGHYYALHIRRGDFQFKEVKLSAADIWKNLHFPNGTAVIPNNSFVYISTDDPDGICKDCLKERKPCESYPYPKPVGCPDDTSWQAFLDKGWTLRFLRDYMSVEDGGTSSSGGVSSLNNLNPNFQGMIEVIICSRALAFAGTVHSTFTGYILRIRGFHGLGTSSFYHSNNALMYLQDEKSRNVGTGWWREWTGGWEDDEFSLTI